MPIGPEVNHRSTSLFCDNLGTNGRKIGAQNVSVDVGTQWHFDASFGLQLSGNISAL